MGNRPGRHGERATIVVGIDGSGTGDQALQWSITEAVATQRALHLVHCVVASTPRSRTNTSRWLLADAEAFVRVAAPSVPVRTELAYGVPATELLDRAGPSDLLVVGNRGLGRLASFTERSVSASVAAHARCPVVVVRRRHAHCRRPGRPRVVVGVDGSSEAASAVDFAFTAAASRSAELTAVLAWSAPFAAHPAAMPPMERVADVATRRLAAALQDSTSRFPDVAVQSRLARANPCAALVDESEEADLLVVGARGGGVLGGVLRRSVSQALLRRPGCPVAVVRTAGSADSASSRAA